jgi:SulP family sulfate permease
LNAGLAVAVMLVPQSMAYALLAGLPPQIGLYASIVPLLVYALLGTSRVLAVGPVAMVSVLVAAGISQLDPASASEYFLLALTLALMTGLIQLALGIFRVGFIVNFLSHPVLSGFVSAAAIVIGASQLKHVLGLSIPRTDHFYDDIMVAVQQRGQINFATLIIATASITILVYFKTRLGTQLKRLGVPDILIMPITKSSPLTVVALGTLAVWLFGLNENSGVAIVGTVPAGLPPLTTPSFNLDVWQTLLPMALTISLVGYMSSISIAKSLASKRRQKVDADQELIALGVSNMGAAFTGGFPVTGGLARSVVNFSAGANTPLASLFSAGLIALTLLFLTPLFYYLPNAVLAAIILVAVSSLFDFKTFKQAWRYNHSDALSLLITFFAVLIVNIESGILIGAGASLMLFLWRTSRPHSAIIGRLGDTEHFRNVFRHDVYTNPRILMIRVDESLYFPNAQYLDDALLHAVADNPAIDHLVLVCSSVNYIDASALEVLRALRSELKNAGVTFHLAEVHGPVMDRLKHIGFVAEMGAGKIFLSPHEALETLERDLEAADAQKQSISAVGN